MSKLLDFSSARPKPDDIKRAGYDGVMRYLSYSAWKNITKEELQGYLDAGLKAGLVWESTSNRVSQGYQAGVSDASEAEILCKSMNLGISFVYFAVDYDAPEYNQPQIDDYLRGCASVIGRENVGVYGSYYVVERCFTNGTATKFWQCSAWSGGKLSQHAYLYQNANKNPGIAGTDYNEVLKDDWGFVSLTQNLDLEKTSDTNVVTEPETQPRSISEAKSDSNSQLNIESPSLLLVPQPRTSTPPPVTQVSRATSAAFYITQLIYKNFKSLIIKLIEFYKQTNDKR